MIKDSKQHKSNILVARKTHKAKQNVIGLIVWLLLLVPLLVGDPQQNVTIYIVAGLSLAAFLALYFRKNQINKIQAKILILFLAVVFIQLLGCLAAGSFSVIRYPVYTLCIAVFVVVGIALFDDINPFAMLLACLFSIGVLFYRAVLNDNSEDVGNSLAGMGVYLCVMMTYSGISCINEGKRNKTYKGGEARGFKEKCRAAIIIVSIGCSCVAIYETQSRTSLFTLLIIAGVFILLSVLKPKKGVLLGLFWILVIFIAIGIVAYINIDNFGWYSTLNVYSVDLFGKNIDSSRPLLWGMSINALGQNWLTGIGTGFLPAYGPFTDVSFHNSYLQLLIPNGVVSLICLILIFYFMWESMAENIDDLLVRLIFAALVGILVYNCFESTLLFNKLSIGFMEWFLLALGVARSLKLSKVSSCSETNDGFRKIDGNNFNL